MREPGRGKMRAARGLAMSVACVLVSTAAHLTAGGAVPLQVEYFLGAALLSAACVALADRRRNPAEIGGLLVLSQLPLHLLLTLAGHDHTTTASDPAMVFAHLGAAAALTVLLSGAEAVIWAFAAFSTTLLFARVHRLLGELPAANPARWTPTFLATTKTRAGPLMVSAAPRRGPPVATLF